MSEAVRSSTAMGGTVMGGPAVANGPAGVAAGPAGRPAAGSRPSRPSRSSPSPGRSSPSSSRSSPGRSSPSRSSPSRPGRANDAWEALLSAHAALVKRFAAEDTWAEVSMREYDVLYTLSKCPEPVRLAELNRHVLLSQPALSRMVDRLAGRGLVERRADPADGRGVRLALTEAGRARQRRVGRGHARSVARALTAALTPAELRALETICQKLAAPGTGPARPHHDEDPDR